MVGSRQHLPGAVESAALLEGAQGENRLAAGMTPPHPRAFEALCDQGLQAASTMPDPMGMFRLAKLAYCMR